MKIFKSLAVFCCAVICALTFTSCGETTVVTEMYNVGIHGYDNGSVQDLTAAQTYLNSKGCKNGDNWTFTDSNTANCDKKAEAKFNELVKNLSREEVAALVSDKFTFTYSCTRSVGAESVTIAAWEYPGK